ncbi:hypothetical protein [Actinomadura sp. 7K507]|uniref:hypothetical protein n=1 Tax=Actinomadura sp. 7K507 TaxID=2530365 RepID=UPI001FB707DA|nr:hypothetical protein [Actinomadura sp. 7K507]
MLFEQRRNLRDGVADGAPAHVEEVGEDLACAESALVEDRGQDPVGVGDLLWEDPTAGSWKTITASLSMAAAFDRGGVRDREAVDESVQILAGHPGECRVGEFVG